MHRVINYQETRIKEIASYICRVKLTTMFITYFILSVSLATIINISIGHMFLQFTRATGTDSACVTVQNSVSVFAITVLNIVPPTQPMLTTWTPGRTRIAYWLLGTSS